MDLTLKFSVPGLVESLNLIGAGEAIALTLRGETLEGTPILGQDCILIVGNIEKQCDSDFDCDADVAGSDAAVFKENSGRSRFNNPCGQLPGDVCPGDFKCDGDVDGEDASIFKSEFGTILM